MRLRPARAAAALLFALAALAPAPALAGKLGDFEGELRKPKRSEPEDTPPRSFEIDPDRDADDCTDFFTCVLGAVLEIGAPLTLAYLPEREKGAPPAPYLRLDSSYQRVVGNIDAYSIRGELGWAFLGAAYEYLRFNEHDPEDTLISWYSEALFRVAPKETFRLDLAVGYRSFRRAGSHGGAQGGVSTGLYPSERWGLEADARWGSISDSTVSDYRGRLLLKPFKLRGLFLHGGYRAVRAGSVTLHGPESGLTYLW